MYKFNYKEPLAKENASEVINKLLLNELRLKQYKSISIILIGDTFSTGDSLGPLVGSLIEDKFNGDYIKVIGTAQNKVCGANLNETIEDIDNSSLVIAIDSSLSENAENIGRVTIRSGSIFPGSGLNKNFNSVGNISVLTCTAMIGLSYKESLLNLAKVPFFPLWQLAQFTAGVIYKAFKQSEGLLKIYFNTLNKLVFNNETDLNNIILGGSFKHQRIKNDFIRQLGEVTSLTKDKKYKSITVLSLGNGVGIENSLGPLVGSILLKRTNNKNVNIVGSIEDPIDEDDIYKITELSEDSFTIVIHNGLSRAMVEGKPFSLEKGSKHISIGNINISGMCSGTGCIDNLEQLFIIASVIVDGLTETVLNFENFILEDKEDKNVIYTSQAKLMLLERQPQFNREG